MDNMNNLMENVRDFFTEQYKGVENSNSFLAFEPLGSMIDPNDFVDENDQISEIKAIEQLSILSDRLPQIDNIFLANTSRLSSVYEELIESASFTGVNINLDDKTTYISKFAEVKKDAEFLFNEAKKASISTPEGDYLPVHGIPKKWYDTESSFWVEKSFSAMSKLANKTPTNETLTGVKKVIPLKWKTNFITSPKVLKKSLAVNFAPTFKTFQAVQVKGNAARIKPAIVQPATRITRRSSRRNFKLNSRRTIKARRVADHRARPTIVPHRKRKHQDVKAKLKVKNTKTIWKNLKVLQNLNLADRVVLTSNIVKNNTAPEVEVRSDGFSMSFEYGIVHLNRQWFNTAMFHYAKLWYCLSLPENYFSTGTKDLKNTGALKSIPTAMILIKNLKIEAAWIDDDKQTALNSVGLGIFNLTDSNFIDNKLVSSGMQIIGWMCDVLPKLPAMGDPNMVE